MLVVLHYWCKCYRIWDNHEQSVGLIIERSMGW